MAGVLTNLFGSVTESAETRTWLTPPRELSIAVIELMAPADTIRVGWIDEGMVRERAIPLKRIDGTDFELAGHRRWR